MFIALSMLNSSHYDVSNGWFPAIHPSKQPLNRNPLLFLILPLPDLHRLLLLLKLDLLGVIDLLPPRFLFLLAG